MKGCSEWDDLTRCRDFETLREHDDLLVNNINSVVKEGDILYHLGDWSFGGDEMVWKFRRLINCKVVHMIGGNHDHHIRRNKIITTDRGLVHAHDLFVSYQEIMEKVIAGRHDVVMCHYPILSYHKMKKGAIHLYGHTHKELNYHTRAICVSIDCHPEFRPFHLDEILQIIKQREANNEHPAL